jgi:hypothetical protein
MRQQDGYDALLADLYGGIGEPERLRRFVLGVAEATGSHVGAVFRQDFATPSASGLTSTGISPDELSRFESEYAGENVWMDRAIPQLRAGAVLFSEDWVSPQELRATRYYAEYLREIDVEHAVGICGAMQNERCAMLTFCHSARQGPYDEAQREYFKRLAPHFVNAYAVFAQLEHWRALAMEGAGVQRAMFLLDADLHWIGGNDVAEGCIAAGWWRARRGTALVPCHPITCAAWRSAQRELAAGRSPRQAIPVYEARGQLVAFARLHACSGSVPVDGMPSYILFVRGVEPADDAGLPLQVRSLFGLTASEAELVISLRRSGELGHAASAVGIAESSARTRLQAVFDKTGTHRQIELLRMLDALVDTLH